MEFSSTAPSVVNQIDITGKQIEQKVEKKLSEDVGMIDPSSVMVEFLSVKDQLEGLLQLCNPVPVVNKCASLLASDTHNIPLFPNEYTEKLQATQYFPELFQKLSPFMTWDNHSILNAIADTCNIPEAAKLLTKFDDRIDSSQPLTSFPIPGPSHHMVPYGNSTHTVLALELDLELYCCTLQDVIDTRSLIQDQCKLNSHCLHLLAVIQTNSTIIYWMIPKSIANLITTNAVQFQNCFYHKGVLQLAVYPGVVICTGRSTLNIESLLFLNTKSANIKLVRLTMYV